MSALPGRNRLLAPDQAVADTGPISPVQLDPKLGRVPLILHTGMTRLMTDPVMTEQVGRPGGRVPTSPSISTICS